MARRSFPPIRNSFSTGSSGLLTARCCHSLALPPLVGNRRAPQHASLASGRRSATGRFPPETSDTIGRLWCHTIGELLAPAPTPTTTSRRSRVVKTRHTSSGTSNDPVTRIGRNPPDLPTQAVVIYLNGIGLNPQSPRGSVGIACVTQSCIPPR